ncbi:MAG: non-canonical purine NTP pyrophosphatase [Oscillospiraceae bacterium]|nr:non-canonical purine NTP pyrophosphatase [Oscillospiraceae bacterium]
MEIIIATGNAGKAEEIAAILALCGGASGRLRVRTVKDIVGSAPDVDENGATLRENAWIKAHAARLALDARRAAHTGRTGSIVIADDSGLFVDSLGGRPGVHSARYGSPDEPGATGAAAALGAAEPRAAEPGNAAQALPTAAVATGAAAPTPPAASKQIALLLEELRGVPAGRRAARFRCIMAVSYPDGSKSFSEGTCEGEIGLRPKGSNGFGFDPIFYIPELGLTMAQLTREQKNVISHRGLAVRAMAADIDAYIERTI